MTRINAGIPVEKLSDQHLLAEHREIKRIPRTTFKSSPPDKFGLGGGHVLFFSNKPLFTFNRYCCLYRECIKRGFNVEYYGDNWTSFKGVPFSPSPSDISLVRERIIQRASESKQVIRYYGKQISINEYIKLLS